MAYNPDNLVDFNLNTIIAIAAFGLAGITLLARVMSQQISLREHEEFKAAMVKRLDEIQTRQDLRVTRQELDDYKASIEIRAEIRRVQYEDLKRAIAERTEIREFSQWREQTNRDFDKIEEDLRTIDKTKPTAGELEMAMKAIDARIRVLEAHSIRIHNGKGEI